MRIKIYEDLVEDSPHRTWGHIESLLKGLPRVTTGHIYGSLDSPLDTESITITANVDENTPDSKLLGAFEKAMAMYLDLNKITVLRAYPRIQLSMDVERGEVRKIMYARFLQAPKEDQSDVGN